MIPRSVPAALALIVAAVVAASSQGTPPQQPLAPPTFRSPVVAVPVDVRVIVYDAAADRVGSAGVTVR